jgi:hypothetical protein
MPKSLQMLKQCKKQGKPIEGKSSLRMIQETFHQGGCSTLFHRRKSTMASLRLALNFTWLSIITRPQNTLYILRGKVTNLFQANYKNKAKNKKKVFGKFVFSLCQPGSSRGFSWA